jgi:hypothetical protein
VAKDFAGFLLDKRKRKNRNTNYPHDSTLSYTTARRLYLPDSVHCW